VVEEVLVEDSGSGSDSGVVTGTKSGDEDEKKTTKEDTPILGDAPSKQMVSLAIALAAIALMR